MRTRLLVVIAIVAVLAASCGNDDDDKATGGATDGAQTVSVNVDGKSDEIDMSSNKFFPGEVTLHPGDTIKFTEIYTGEPHTVTFGTLIEAGLAASDKAGASLATEPPELDKVPDVFPDGPGDAIQTAALPCFVTGELPANGAACPKVAQPAFDGKQTFYNSGYLADKEQFNVNLASDIAPGTYRFMCAIHRGLMQGKVTVVPKGQKAQTAAEVSAAGKQSLADVIAKLKPAFEPLAKLTAATAQAGGGVPEVPDAILDEFGPEELTIPVGGVVTWNVSGPHTISFNTPEDAVGAIIKTPDGAVHLNQKSGAPAGGPGVAPGTPPPAKPTVIDGGTWNGVGFRNSGFLLGFGPPGILKFKLGFSKAGTYQYRCVVHPDMKGTVKVG
jgi:plastocyanin